MGCLEVVGLFFIFYFLIDKAVQILIYILFAFYRSKKKKIDKAIQNNYKVYRTYTGSQTTKKREKTSPPFTYRPLIPNNL